VTIENKKGTKRKISSIEKSDDEEINEATVYENLAPTKKARKNIAQNKQKQAKDDKEKTILMNQIEEQENEQQQQRELSRMDTSNEPLHTRLSPMDIDTELIHHNTTRTRNYNKRRQYSTTMKSAEEKNTN
jgi:hypothetical protein